MLLARSILQLFRGNWQGADVAVVTRNRDEIAEKRNNRVAMGGDAASDFIYHIPYLSTVSEQEDWQEILIRYL